MGMGLRFEQDSHLDDGICALGQWDLVKIWAEKWEYDPPPPPSGPSFESDLLFWRELC
jgi:hypothetical protein